MKRSLLERVVLFGLHQKGSDSVAICIINANLAIP